LKHVQRLQVSISDRKVGELGLDSRARIFFQYDRDWLASGFDLSPGTLPFNDSVQLSPEPAEFNGLPGVFNDSLPDGWGLLLMDRAFQQIAGWQRHEITPLDRLAYIGSRAMGALEYEPALTRIELAEELDIWQMASAASQLLNGETPNVLQQLQIHGGSPGGARPKVTVALSEDGSRCISGSDNLPKGYSDWIVKFRSKEDPRDMGCIETAYGEMARLAGLTMPAFRLLTVKNNSNREEFFAVRRFDKNRDKRHHVISLSGYVYADHRLPCLGYDSVINATRQITGSLVEACKAFRLMVFNILAHNKDDHAKNFAFLYSDDIWTLSPAFDLTFSTGINNQHTTDIAGSGNPDLNQISKIATECGIQKYEAILEEVRLAVRQWKNIAIRQGVSDVQINSVDAELEKIDKRIFG